MINCVNDKVMKEMYQIRSKCLTVRFNDEERKKLSRLCNKAQCNSLSEYARDVLLGEPVIIKYRNQSADDFLEEMILLKKELNAIGNNFNQAVHKLHLLDKIPEFRFRVTHYEGLNHSVVMKIEEIKSRVHQLYEQWLRK